MKIARIETFLVAPRWLFCRVETEDGLVGWGEPLLEGRAETVRTAVGELTEILVGRDPRAIEDAWQIMTRGGFYRGGPILSSAVAGLDQALWDIAGKAAGLPVYSLLGGPVRDRMRVYSWVGGDDPLGQEDAVLGEEVEQRLAAGFTAIKTNGIGPVGSPASRSQLRAAVDRIHKLREDFPSLDIGVDFHARVAISDAVQLVSRLDDAELLFIEEPTRPEDVSQIGRVVSATTTPIALGERLYS
ncbi:MAG TPA: galactonate dehydratase, partial [Acidimicrobiia bacterium]